MKKASKPRSMDEFISLLKTMTKEELQDQLASCDLKNPIDVERAEAIKRFIKRGGVKHVTSSFDFSKMKRGTIVKVISSKNINN